MSSYPLLKIPGVPGQAAEAFRRPVGRTVPHWMARIWVSQSMVDTWLIQVTDQTCQVCGNWKMSFLTFHLLERISPNDFHIFRGLKQPPSCGFDRFFINCDPLDQWYPTIGISHKAGSPTTQKTEWLWSSLVDDSFGGVVTQHWLGIVIFYELETLFYSNTDHCPIGIWKAHHGRRCPTKTHLCPKENCCFTGEYFQSHGQFFNQEENYYEPWGAFWG